MAFGDVVQTNSGTSTLATTTLASPTTAGNLVLTVVSDDYNGTPDKFRDGAADVPRRLSVVVEVRWLGLDPELHHRLRSPLDVGTRPNTQGRSARPLRSARGHRNHARVAHSFQCIGGRRRWRRLCDRRGHGNGGGRRRRLAAFLGGRSACLGSMYSCKLISPSRRRPSLKAGRRSRVRPWRPGRSSSRRRTDP